MSATNGQSGPPTIAVIHRAGGRIRVLIGAAGAREVLSWAALPEAEAGSIAGWMKEHGAVRAVVVLPAASVTCRTCALPAAEPDHLAAALSLQVEALVPDDVPLWRRAAAVLQAAPGETSRTGIIVAWPPVAGDPGVPRIPGVTEKLDHGGRPRHAGDDLPITFTADVAALGALLDGHRPAEPIVWVDRSDGSIAMAISHANGAILRAARAGTGASWADDVVRALAETALSAGHTPAFTSAIAGDFASKLPEVPAGEARLFVPRDLPATGGTMPPGAPQDPQWWRDWGVALSAYLAATGDFAGLAAMKVAAPAVSPSRARRIVETLSRPASAIPFIAACLLLAMLAPLAVAGLRLAVLSIKLPDLGGYLKDAQQVETQLAMYRELQTQAWPMTKLLSDVACSTPEFVDVDQIRLRHDEPLSIGGRVKPDSKGELSAQEVMGQMLENLRATNIFEEIHLNWGDPNSFGAYEFSLLATVARPYHRYDYPPELDFGLTSWGERLYPKSGAEQEPEGPAPSEAETAGAEAFGEVADLLDDAEIVVEPPAEQQDENTGEPIRPPRDPRRPIGDDPEISGVDARDSGALPPSQDIPDPITPEQIAAMTLPEAQEAWSRVAHALRRSVADADTRKRLREEFRLIRDRIRELRPEDAGAAEGH